MQNLHIDRARADETVRGVRSVLEKILNVQGRDCCEACGCLCLPDEVCPNCKLLAATGA